MVPLLERKVVRAMTGWSCKFTRVLGLFVALTAASGFEARAEALASGEELQAEVIAMAEDFAQSQAYHKEFGQNAADLDFSIESLAVLDSELDMLREDLPDAGEGKDLGSIPEDMLANVVLGFGSYTGEVIRRNSEEPYRWIGFEEMPEDARSVVGDEVSLGTVLLLAVGDTGSVTFPFAKVMKYLENGPEDSLKFFAQVMLSEFGGEAQ